MIKVVGIGFQKTGTTSLGEALTLLGYRVKAGGSEMVPELMTGNLDPLRKMAERYDAFEDHPWPQHFRDMDAWFPGSKFILTVRDEEAWLKSVVSHLAFVSDRSQVYTYGVGFPAGNEDIFLQRYRRHNAEVRAFFADRRDDLLEIDFSHGKTWGALCDFLGQEVPTEPFPHSNRGKYGYWRVRAINLAGRLIKTFRRSG